MNKFIVVLLSFISFNSYSFIDSYKDKYLKIDFKREEVSLVEDSINLEVFVTPLRNYKFFGIYFITDGVIVERGQDLPNSPYLNILSGETKKFKLSAFLKNEKINKIMIKALLIDDNKNRINFEKSFYIPISKSGVKSGEKKEVYPPSWNLQ